MYPRDTMVPVPRDTWPKDGVPRTSVFRSQDFLVQCFEERGGMTRLSVNRTDVDRHGMWKDGITWEQLQWIKNQCGFADRDAVEVFPPDEDLVNVSNVRHLWIYPQGMSLSFAWRAGKGSGYKTGDAAMRVLA